MLHLGQLGFELEIYLKED